MRFVGKDDPLGHHADLLCTQIYQYDPSRSTVTALHTRAPALLRKRFFTLQRALQASVFGLLVHNVGLASSSTLLRDLKAALRKREKKFYTVSVGRLNPAKLGNFEVVECWVLIGCREGGMVDGKVISSSWWSYDAC